MFASSKKELSVGEEDTNDHEDYQNEDSECGLA